MGERKNNNELTVLVEKVEEDIRELFNGDFSGHDYWHSVRVYNNAMLILKTEDANVLVVALAALLHDVDDVKLFCTEDYENARKIMGKYQIDDEVACKVIEAIQTVSFKGTDSKRPHTIEGMIVQDADRLDAIGAIGIARVFAFGGSHERAIYDPSILPQLNMSKEEYRKHKGTSINHFYEKLFLLKEMMNTKTAEEIAKHRNRIMQQYVDEFMREWNGKC